MSDIQDILLQKSSVCYWCIELKCHILLADGAGVTYKMTDAIILHTILYYATQYYNNDAANIKVYCCLYFLRFEVFFVSIDRILDLKKLLLTHIYQTWMSPSQHSFYWWYTSTVCLCCGLLHLGFLFMRLCFIKSAWLRIYLGTSWPPYNEHVINVWFQMKPVHHHHLVSLGLWSGSS